MFFCAVKCCTIKSVGTEQAGLVPNVWSFLATALGFVLGLIAEPVKAWVLRKFELKPARREIYTELADYIAKIQRVDRGVGHQGHPEEVEAADYESSKQILMSPPKFEVIHWYKANRLDLLLRIDGDRGIRMLSEKIVAQHERVNAQGRAMFALPKDVLDLVRAYEKSLDEKLLRKYISTAHRKEHELSASQ